MLTAMQTRSMGLAAAVPPFHHRCRPERPGTSERSRQAGVRRTWPSPRRTRNRLRLRRRHLDRARRRRRGAPARVAPGHRIASALLAGRPRARVHVDAHRRRRPLRAHASRPAMLRRLTFDDAPEQPDGWSRDGKWLYFSSTSQDMAGMDDVLRIAADGGTAMPVTDDRTSTSSSARRRPTASARVQRARHRGGSVVAARPQPHRRVGDLDAGRDRRRRAGGYDARSPIGGAKALWPMWSGGWRVAVLRVGSRRHGELWHDGRVARPARREPG